mgnify:FL=1
MSTALIVGCATMEAIGAKIDDENPKRVDVLGVEITEGVRITCREHEFAEAVMATVNAHCLYNTDRLYLEPARFGIQIVESWALYNEEDE